MKICDRRGAEEYDFRHKERLEKEVARLQKLVDDAATCEEQLDVIKKRITVLDDQEASTRMNVHSLKQQIQDAEK